METIFLPNILSNSQSLALSLGSFFSFPCEHCSNNLMLSWYSNLVSPLFSFTTSREKFYLYNHLIFDWCVHSSQPIQTSHSPMHRLVKNPLDSFPIFLLAYTAHCHGLHCSWQLCYQNSWSYICMDIIYCHLHTQTMQK